MERKVKVLVAVAWALSIVCSLYIGYALAPWLQMRHGVTELKPNVLIVWEYAGGRDIVYSGNVITNLHGEKYLRDAMAYANNTGAVIYIGIGNGTASVDLYELPQEYDRQQGTVSPWINNGDYAFNVTKKWINISGVTLNCTMAYYSASGATGFAVANFEQTKYSSPGNLTVTWIFTFDAN